MTWRTHPQIIQLRNIARKIGLTRALGRLMPSSGYEMSFDRELLSAIRQGDVVWDVGANIGYYTKKFAEAVGPSGRVFAFEPFPTIAGELRETVSNINNIIVNGIALGTHAGAPTMQAGADSLGATSRIVEEHGEAGIQIEMSTGDEAIRSGLAEQPNVLKIDTEGFEFDVLKGMVKATEDRLLRAIFIEVHFGLLAERGMPNAPAEIEKLLTARGFCTRWVDSSHIAATRD